MRLTYAFLFLLFVSCNTHREQNATAGGASDSIQITGLLKKVYKWHGGDHKVDFDIVVDDSVQTKVDLAALDNRIQSLRQTGFFSAAFIAEYRQLGEMINRKLVNADPKYHNEINFPFQEADPWTWFQDDVPEYWTSFLVEDMKIAPANASLKWYLLTGQTKTTGYEVAFTRENGLWKISYMAGFDQKQYKE